MKYRFKILFLFFSLFQANALLAQYQLIKVNGNYCYNTEATFIFTGYNCSYVDFQVTGATVIYEDDQQFRVRWTGSTGQVWVNYNCGGSGSLTTGPQSIGTTVTPSVSISTNLNNTCVGRSITFTASPTNGGSSPYYSWRVNGSTAPGSTNSRYYTTSSLSDNDVVTCVMSTSLSCYTQYSATSNGITMNLSPKDVMTVTVNGPGTLCGSMVTADFYASVSNGSGTLTYKWFKNSSQVATSNPLTGLSVVNGDIVRCEVSSSDACVQSPAVSSNYSMVVTGLQTFSAGVNPSDITMCTGASVTFTANPSHTASSYQWKMNGSNQEGQTGSTFTTTASTLAQLQSVQVVVTTNATCVNTTTTTGSASSIPFTVKPLPNASITGPASGCGSVTLQSSTGTGYSYVWKNSGGSTVGTSSSYNVTVDGSYTVTTTLNNCTRTSSPKAVDIHAVPTNPVSMISASRCGTGSVTLSGTPGSNGNTMKWYTASSGGTYKSTGTSYAPSLSSTTTYYASSYNTTTGCESTATRPGATATINSIPTAYSVTGGGNYCEGGSGVSLGLSDTQTGILYQLKLGSTDIGSPVSGTNNAISFGTHATLGTYSVVATNSSTTCTSNMANTKAIALHPILTSPIAVGDDRCGTGSVTLSGTPGSNGNSLKWYAASSGGSILATGTSYPTPSISNTTTYYISSYNTSTTCESQTTRTPVTAIINSNPTVDAGGNLDYFVTNSSSALTSTGESPAGGIWSGAGITGYNFVPGTVGIGNHNITYTYTDANNCIGIDTRNIQVHAKPSASAISSYIERGGSTILSLGQTYDTYQWYHDNSSIGGATGATYGASKVGTYKAVVSIGNSSEFTDPISIYPSMDQSGDMNYIITHTIQEEGITAPLDIDDLTIGQLAEQIQYFDGLGRPIQTVTTQGSPSGGDIVQPIIYDEFGRDTVQFLPYVASDISGLYKSSAIGDQELFYANASDKIVDDTAPYAVKLLEKSPLNRILEQGAPGDAWQPGTGHTVKLSYETNGTDEVLKFDGNYGKPSLSSELTFDGNNDYVALNMYFNQAGALPKMTLEAWVKTDVSGLGWTANWSIIDFDRSEFFNVFVRGDNGKVEFSTYATSGGIDDFVGNAPVNDGQWHHIAAVYDGTDKIIYVDGVEDARVSNPHSGVGIGKNVTRYGFIGDGSEATSFNASRNNAYYKGSIRDVRFWNIDRTITEIQSDRYKQPGDKETNLLAWWNMDSGKGSSTLTDLTGNGHNGTLYNFDLANCWGGSKYYDPGMLSVTKTTDEHDNVVKEYKDKLGNVVLKRIYLTTSDILDTYYIYDDFNNLRVVLPPEAVRNFDTQYNTNPQKFLDNWAFLYKYDARQRMTHKKVPGADWVYMVYDERDRLILTQDGNQRDINVGGSDADWLFTKYDTLNRPIITGIYTHSFVYDQETMQSYVNGQFDQANTFYTEQRGNTVHGYTNHAFPTDQSKCEYLSVTYYDDYDFIAAQPAEWGTQYNYSADLGAYNTTTLSKVRGQVTGAKTRILGTNEFTKSVSYYDRKYRVVQSVMSNQLGGIDRSYSQYDFVGKVLKSKLVHEVPGKKTNILEDMFTYDHAGRQIDHFSGMAEPVTWKDVVGVSEAENGDLIKTATDNWGNAGAATVNKIKAGTDGWIEMRGVHSEARTMLGLSTTNANASYTSIEFAIYIHYNNNVYVYESGSNKGTFGTWVEGDIFRVERIGNNIYYKKNGQTFYTSTKTDGGDLIGDISIYYNGAGIYDVYMMTSGSVLVAHNEYNELGELVDKQLHSTDNGASYMQSVDYRYNIRGWLTNINESDLSLQDAGDPIDFFGMELGYNTDIGTGAQEMYNGNISSIKWSNFGAVDGIGERAYNYGYDKINRLLAANHMVKTGAWMGAGNSLKVDSIHYDYNGNIKSLNRRDLLGGNMDLLTYSYGTGISQSNKLLSVTDAGNDNKGFKDGNTDGEDYFYDANGNMHVDKNKGIQSIRYNYLNLPDSVGMDEGKYILYTYDAAGVKLRQTVYDSTYIKQTDYIGGFIYEDTVLQLIQQAEGRIVPKYTSTGDLDKFVYEYHLKDHLGNVRLTFTTDPSEDTYTATMENATQQQEQADFYPSYDDNQRYNATIHDHTQNGSSSYSLMLNAGAGRIIGLAKSMQVLPGDTIDMEVYAKYLPTEGTTTNIATAIAPAITGAFGLTASATGELLNAFNSLNGLFAAGPIMAAGSWSSGDEPMAFINYILFDKNFVNYDQGFQRITSNGELNYEKLDLSAVATKPGYIYIYISNETPKQMEVYFDDLTINHRHTPSTSIMGRKSKTRHSGTITGLGCMIRSLEDFLPRIDLLPNILVYLHTSMLQMIQ
jgi:hypothetical protein